jgi:hypothetical protein
MAIKYLRAQSSECTTIDIDIPGISEITRMPVSGAQVLQKSTVNTVGVSAGSG